MLLDSLILHQKTTKHVDVAHITIQFLTPSTVAPIQMHISCVSVSKRWTRLDLSSVQLINGAQVVRCTAHALFTDLPTIAPAVPPSPDFITVLPHTPSPFARTTPFITHPSDLSSNESVHIFNFKQRMRWSNGSKRNVVWEGSDKERLDWAGYVQLTEDNKVDLRESAVLIGFFSEIPSIQFSAWR